MCSRCLFSPAIPFTTAARRAKSVRCGSRVVLAAAASAVFGACGVPAPQAPQPIALPTHNFPPVAVSGVATGGVIEITGSCIWLRSDATDSNLVWPKGFVAVAPPLEITGNSGTVIIRVGDRVELGVGDANLQMPGCPLRGAFYVGEVSSVNGISWPDGTPKAPPIDQRPIR